MNKEMIPTGMIEVDSTSRDFMRADLSIRNHSLVIDEPVELGGTDIGITPVEAGIAGLTSCVSIIIRVIAKRMRIHVEDVSVKASAEFDLRGVMFQEEVDLPFRKVDLHIQMRASLTAEEMLLLQQKIRAFCPMHKLFSTAGTEVVEHWQFD